MKILILSQELDKILLPNKVSWKNVKKSLRYFQKTSKIMDFLYTIPPIIVMWQAPRADAVSKIVLKVFQEDFKTLAKNTVDWLCRSFHELFYN